MPSSCLPSPATTALNSTINPSQFMKYLSLITVLATAALPVSPAADSLPADTSAMEDIIGMAEEMVEILTHTADVLDTVTDKNSADVAAAALAPLKERAKAIQAATMGMEKMDDATKERVMQTLLPLFSSLGQRMDDIMQRLEANDFYGSEALKQFMSDN